MNNVRPLEKIMIYILQIFLVFVVVLPLIFAFVSSVRPLEDIFKYTSSINIRTFIPEKITLQPYIELFSEYHYGRVLLNTMFVTVVTVFFGILFNSMAGFAFAKFNFIGKKFLYLLVLITFMIPFELISVPLYSIVQKFGWVNTYFALIIPCIANGLVIFMYRQFFVGIPDYIIESSFLDGLSWWKTFFKIILPITKPISISAGLIIFLSQWESFLWPLLATRSVEFRTVQAAISDFQTEHATIWNNMFAATIIAFLVPVLIIIPLQRFYIQGISNTGTKE